MSCNRLTCYIHSSIYVHLCASTTYIHHIYIDGFINLYSHLFTSMYTYLYLDDNDDGADEEEIRLDELLDEMTLASANSTEGTIGLTTEQAANTAAISVATTGEELEKIREIIYRIKSHK